MCARPSYRYTVRIIIYLCGKKYTYRTVNLRPNAEMAISQQLNLVFVVFVGTIADRPPVEFCCLL